MVNQLVVSLSGSCWLWVIHHDDILSVLQNLSLVKGGCLSNLRKQIQIAHQFGVPVVVALNVFK